jgi:hypothetical protein
MMRTLIACLICLCAGCGGGASTGTIRIVSDAWTDVVDVRIREVTGYTTDGLIQLGPDQADVDYMPVGTSQDYELQPTTYWIRIESVTGSWITDSGNNIQLQAEDLWTVRYTHNGGVISKDR